jgi:hypothetical protein
MKTAVQIAIEKIDEQIEIAQISRIEASKVKDATSMERHHGKKIALVFMRQELVNLLEMEKQQIINAWEDVGADGVTTAEEYYTLIKY